MYGPFRVIAFTLGIAIGHAAGTGLGFSAAAICQDEPPASSETSSADLELQTEIQNTLDQVPSLSGGRVRATVTEQQIELSGRVARNRDKLTAGRIALSYAANKKLANHIIVTGGSLNVPTGSVPSEAHAPAPSTSPPPGQGSKSQNGKSRATNPEPGKNPQPPLP